MRPERAYSYVKKLRRPHGKDQTPPNNYQLVLLVCCDTGTLLPLTSRRSVFVLVASSCYSADFRVFASAGAASRLRTSQLEAHSHLFTPATHNRWEKGAIFMILRCAPSLHHSRLEGWLLLNLICTKSSLS